jgi:hypothetical protein
MRAPGCLILRNTSTAASSNTPVKLDKEGNVDLTNITPDEVKKYGEKAKDLNPAM